MAYLHKAFPLAVLILSLIGCNKPNVPPPTAPQNPIPPPQIKYDSTFLLTGISGSGKGSAMSFEYDSLNNLTKFYLPYSWATNFPCYVYYKNGKMNYIVGEHGSKTKASMVFVYGSGGKCTNIYYTKTKYSASPIDNSSPTFTDLSLTNLQNVYDSLVYSPSYNRVDKLFRLTLGTRQPYGIIQFSYSDNSDTSINKIEEYRFDANGKQFLHDQLLITHDVTPCPITKLFWFQPFVGDCCTDFLVESPSGKLQLLYDGPSTDVDRFLPMASNRFVKGYKVYNSWGLENYTHTTFDYKYSADSLTLDTSTPQDPSVSVQWRFKKARR